MFKKLLVTSLLVCSVLSKSTFIGDARKRAKLFELTDNEVAVFRITLPDDEYLQLKEEIKTSASLMPPPEMDENGNFVLPPPPPGMEGNLPPLPGMGEEGTSFAPPFDGESFKSKNASMIVELNNKEKSFDEVTIGLGGSSSRMYGKQGFNLKVRGKDRLYGRVHFRLRPDAREATFLRSKLSCDIHNRLGLPSVSANYATMYINGEYMGFYVLLDALKLSWVELEYDDKDSTTLYQCKNMNNQLTLKSSSTGCVNENEEVTDHSEWNDLLKRFDAAESAEDIEDIFDIDQFLTEIAFEYLSGSWDHYLNFGHNYYMYKPKNDKWKFLLYDFDGELGQEVFMGVGGSPFSPAPPKTNSTDFPTYTFEEWTQPRHLVDILILNNSTRFDNILRKVVKKAFNPTVLFPHIDELKEFIRPYVELDKKPGKDGKYPGRLNEVADDYSLEQWDANSEFTRVTSSNGFGQSYGVKYWILAKYRYVCKAYHIDDCDPVYLDENYEIPIDKAVEPKEDMPSKPPFPPPPSADTPTDGESPIATTAAEPLATTTVEQPNATTTVEQPNATNIVEQPNATNNVEQPNATTTVEQPKETTTVEQPKETTTVEQPKETTTRRRKCYVKKTVTATKN